ncbi:MAG: bis(5'-nucleosyl)-tetraphosphatase (symmetrical) YqeK [Anaerolineaceae bacterium]
MNGSAVGAQIETIRAAFFDRPSRLVRHVERVVLEAVDLADRWGADPERAALAGWGHDLFRALSGEQQLKLAREVGLLVTAHDEAEPVVLHGPNAAIVLRERFAVTDHDALAAVRDHTLGRPEMPLLAKIILIADKVEPRKRARTPVMREIRRLARRDLDLALLCWADWKWVEERAHGWESHSQHWEARRRWVAEHHAEIGLPKRVDDDDDAQTA